ncbi:IS630 family transposase [Parageobacillus galactosidasius]|uniref:IS630 family transposase n=1 Tax=Parageobacillus galactosidasius TaxID=883812 RepID=UPI001FE48327|nr:IS630 family transposase [Parageobacillus galactosidasius]
MQNFCGLFRILHILSERLHALWSVKGRQKQIPTYGHHATVSLLGGVNIKTGEFHCMETNQCNAQAFLQFLQYTLDQYPDKHVVMVLDNAKIHRAKILQPFLHEHEERLTLIFLPPYSPNLNFSLSTQETEYSVSCVEKISPLSIQIHFRETLPHLHYTKFLTVPTHLP